MGLFNPKYSVTLEPVESGSGFVAELPLGIGPLEGLSATDHAVLEERENLKPLVVTRAGHDDEHTEATAA